MKRMLVIIAAGLVLFLAGYSVFVLRQSLMRERQLGVANKFPDVELQLIGAENRSVRLPSGKKMMIVFFRYD